MHQRLRKRWQFVRVAQKGVSCPAATLIVQFILENSDPHPHLRKVKTVTSSQPEAPMEAQSGGGSRQLAPLTNEINTAVGTGIAVGLTASRRVGGAVRRNRAKRRLREAIRLVLPTLALPACDIVVIAKAATVEAPFDFLVRDLTYSIKKCLKEVVLK
jgi:ribonuclease P protein component